MLENFEVIKGTNEYLSEEQYIREKIKNILSEEFQKYGFAPAETPILCTYDLLASKYSAEADILNEIYKLSDQGKRNLGLRFDLTITLVRMILSNPQINFPIKRYEIGKVFRDGPVKVGRLREFTQCDIDAIGISSMLQEAEYMDLIKSVFDRLDLDITIIYNNRKLLTGLIEHVFATDDLDTIRKIIMIIDKKDKLNDKEIIEEFKKENLDDKKYLELNKYLNKNLNEIMESINAEAISNENINQGIKELIELTEFTKNSKASSVMNFAPFLARGIDIYTGTVWEVIVKNRKINDTPFNVSISGGGRYDKIITNFIDNGKEYPAVGMSFGLDVIYQALKLKNKDEKESMLQLFIIPLNTQQVSIELANKLRESGLRCDVEKMDRRVKKSMQHANRENIPFVTVIGEDEIKNNKIIIRNMYSGEEEEFELDDFDKIIKYILKNKLIFL